MVGLTRQRDRGEQRDGTTFNIVTQQQKGALARGIMPRAAIYQADGRQWALRVARPMICVHEYVDFINPKL